MIIQKYLKYLNEFFEPDLDSEKQDVNKKRKEKYIFLFHGTRAKPEIIKKEGLKLSKANKYGFEEEKNGPYISFTSNKEYAKHFTWGLFSKTPILICKLETKFLKFGYNIKEWDEYIYYKDVPPKDIFFPDQQDKILKTEKYLEL
jgi:hypothetical protein